MNRLIACLQPVAVRSKIEMSSCAAIVNSQRGKENSIYKYRKQILVVDICFILMFEKKQTNKLNKIFSSSYVFFPIFERSSVCFFF